MSLFMPSRSLWKWLPLFLLVMVFISSSPTATGSQSLHDPRSELNLGLNTASASSPTAGLDDTTGSQSDFHEDMEWNLKEPSLNDRFLTLEASSTSRILNPSSSSFNNNVLEDIPCPSSCDAICESHVKQFIRHLMAVSTLDKVQLQEEIEAVIHVQRQKQYVPEEDEARVLESSPSLSSLSSMEADSQSSTILIKEEKVEGKVRLSYAGEGDFYNSTSLILSPSFSRHHERRLVDVTTIPWSLVTSSASWSGRYYHSSVALDSNTIVLMGGWTTSK